MTRKLPIPLARLARRQGVVRTRDFAAAGVSWRELGRLVSTGLVHRDGWGVYSFDNHDPTEKHSLAVAALRAPKGVVCLLSALAFHGLTTQNPWEVWIAIDGKARAPNLQSPALRVVRFSGAALHGGVEHHRVEGVPVRVYSVAKTVADLFKFRNKVGTNIALEALREALGKKRTTRDEIVRYARSCRMLNVMLPYLECV